MTIPSFTDEDILNDYDTKFHTDYVWTLARQWGWSFDFAYTTMQELREYIMDEGLSANVIRSDGSIDVSKARSPGLTYLDEYAKEGKVVLKGDPGATASYVGYIDGVFSIIWGAAAIPYIAMAVLPGPRQLLPPNLMLVGFGPHRASSLDGMGGTLQVVDFAASFVTIYGETELSNPVQIGPLLDWTSITLAVVKEDIPDYATAVKYYRRFGDGGSGVYRLVGKVKIDGSE